MAIINVSEFSPRGRVGVEAPKMGQTILPKDLDFSGPNDYVMDFSAIIANGKFSAVRGVFIDNHFNPNNLEILVDDTGCFFPVPAFSAGWWPIVATEGSKITVSGLGGASDVVTTQWFNYSITPFVYSGFSPIVPGFAVEAYPPTLAAAPTNRNTTLAAGVAANVFPAVVVATQKRFTNNGGDNVFYKVGGIATGSFAAGDKTLIPGQTIITPYRTSLAISMFCAVICNVEAEEYVFA